MQAIDIDSHYEPRTCVTCGMRWWATDEEHKAFPLGRRSFHEQDCGSLRSQEAQRFFIDADGDEEGEPTGSASMVIVGYAIGIIDRLGGDITGTHDKSPKELADEIYSLVMLHEQRENQRVKHDMLRALLAPLGWRYDFATGLSDEDALDAVVKGAAEHVNRKVDAMKVKLDAALSRESEAQSYYLKVADSIRKAVGKDTSHRWPTPDSIINLFLMMTALPVQQPADVPSLVNALLALLHPSCALYRPLQRLGRGEEVLDDGPVAELAQRMLDVSVADKIELKARRAIDEAERVVRDHDLYAAENISRKALVDIVDLVRPK